MSEKIPHKSPRKKVLEAAVFSGVIAGSAGAAHAADINHPPQKPAIVEKAPKKNSEHPFIRHGEKGTLVTLARDKGIGAISATEHVTPSWPRPDSWSHVGEIAERLASPVTVDFTVKIPEEDLKNAEKFLRAFHIEVTLHGGKGAETTLRVREVHAKTFTETGYLNPEEADKERQRQIKYAIEKAVHTVCSLLQYPKRAFNELFDPGDLHIDGITVHKAVGETSPEAEEPESIIQGHVDEKNVEELGPRRARHLLDGVKEYCDEHGMSYVEDHFMVSGRENDFTSEELRFLETLSSEYYGHSQKNREYVSVFRLVQAANDKTLPEHIQRQVEPILESKRNAVTVMTPDGKLLTVVVPIPLLALFLGGFLLRLRPRGMELRFSTGYGVHDTSTPHRDLAHHGRIAREQSWVRIGWLPERLPNTVLSVHGLHLSELSTPTIRALREEFNNEGALSDSEDDVIQETIEDAREQGAEISEQDAYWIYHAGQDNALQERIAHELQESFAQLRGVSKDRTFILLDNPATQVLSTFNDDFQQRIEALHAHVVREVPLFCEQLGIAGVGTGRLSVMIPKRVEDITPQYAANLLDEIEERDATHTRHWFNVNSMRNEETHDPFGTVYVFINGESEDNEDRLTELLLRPLADRLPSLRSITVVGRSATETQRVAHHTEQREVIPTDDIPESVVLLPGIRNFPVSYIDLPQEGTIGTIQPWPRTRPRQEGDMEYRRQNRNPILGALRRLFRRP